MASETEQAHKRPIWVRLDALASINPKTLGGSIEAWALWTAGLCHSNTFRTNGVIEKSSLHGLLPVTNQSRRKLRLASEELVAIGRWVDLGDAWEVHGYADEQEIALWPPKPRRDSEASEVANELAAKDAERRRKAAEKKARQRANKRAREAAAARYESPDGADVPGGRPDDMSPGTSSPTPPDADPDTSTQTEPNRAEPNRGTDKNEREKPGQSQGETLGDDPPPSHSRMKGQEGLRSARPQPRQDRFSVSLCADGEAILAAILAQPLAFGTLASPKRIAHQAASRIIGKGDKRDTIIRGIERAAEHACTWSAGEGRDIRPGQLAKMLGEHIDRQRDWEREETKRKARGDIKGQESEEAHAKRVKSEARHFKNQRRKDAAEHNDRLAKAVTGPELVNASATALAAIKRPQAGAS